MLHNIKKTDSLSKGVMKEIPIPSQAQLNWQNAELTALVCWDLHVFDGEFYRQPQARISPVEDYNTFNPQQYDTDQWVKTLKEAGFKIAIFTVSHETGFFFHQSEATPYCMKALKWRDGQGDILRDFKASCKKYDILPGVYIGTRWNSFYGIHDFLVNGEGEFAKNRQKHYNRMVEKIVEEIFSNYGDWAIVWFDGGAHGPDQGGPDVLSAFEKYQKNCIFYHNLQRADIRWGGSETGTVPYPCWGNFPYPYSHGGEDMGNRIVLLKSGDPEGEYFMPAMSDAPLRGHNGHDWFWEPDREHTINPLENLVNMYYNSVGHNSTLILGVTPNPDGQIPVPDADRLREFGEEINKRFSEEVATTSGMGNEFLLRIPKGKKVNQLVVGEDISMGERIRKFIVEGKTERGWESVVEGSCVGHKFIAQFDEREFTQLKLTIKERVLDPRINEFTVYHY